MGIKKLKSVKKSSNLGKQKPHIELLEICFDTFLAETGLSTTFRTCFISDKQLEKLSKDLKKPKKKILSEDIFPTNGSIKSGDFGEIAFQYLLETGEKLHFFFYRWRHKDQNNKSASGSDLLGAKFEKNASSPSENDKLFVLEAKATFSKEQDSIVQSAIDSIQKDYQGRVAKTLFSALRKRNYEDPSASTEDITRFLNTDNPTFKIEYIAAISKDKTYWKDSYAVYTDEGIDKKNRKFKKKIPDRIIVILFDNAWNKINKLFEQSANV